MQLLKDILNKENETLVFHSPYRFLKNINQHKLVEETVVNPILKEIETGAIELIKITIAENEHIFLLKKLAWETEYFGFENYKIVNVFYTHQNFKLLTEAIIEFKIKFGKIKKAYFFADLPSEDTTLTQAFNLSGFRLVEARLNYYYEGVKEYNTKERFPVRLSKAEDAEILKEVAVKMRNKFDRFHGDALVDNELADRYIGTFAYNSVMGFADFVLVPKILDTMPFGFLAANKPVDVLGMKVSKLVLAAIDNSNHKGWLLKLLSETLYLLQENQTEYLTTITQTSNIAAFKTWEKFGFKLGFITNILVLKND